jgi:hypothetical protein
MRIRVGGSVGRPALRRRGAVAARVAGPVASRGFAGLRLGLGKGDHHGNTGALASVVVAFGVLLEDASTTNGGHCLLHLTLRTATSPRITPKVRSRAAIP